jgi:hypothetical protein
MNPSDFFRLPPAVSITFVVMLWPAIWAAASFVMALTTDILHATRRAERPALAPVRRMRRT